MHGGAAPQVQRKAAERIAHASDVAVLQILALMQAPDTPAPVKLAAARDLLDRANVSGKQVVELELPWRELLDGIVATVPEGSELRPFVEGQPEPDPLVIEAQRVDEDDYTPDDSDYSGSWAYGHDLPSGLPHSKQPAKTPGHERAVPVIDGSDRPPPRHPLPERRRVEPEPPLGPRPPRRGRVAGRR